MDDTGGVGGAESFGDLAGVADDDRDGHAAFGDQLEERFAIDKLDDHVLSGPVVNDVVNGDDVGVIESGDGLGFLYEAETAVGIGSHAGGERFDGDEAIEARVAGFVDFAHAAGADSFEELVLEDGSRIHWAAFGQARRLTGC